MIYPLPICGTHTRLVPATCDCPIETRARLLKAGVIRPGPGISLMPWLSVPTLRLDDAGHDAARKEMAFS